MNAHGDVLQRLLQADDIQRPMKRIVGRLIVPPEWSRMSVDASIQRRTQACRPPWFKDFSHSGASWKQRAICATLEAIARGSINVINKKRDVGDLPGLRRLIVLVIALTPETIFRRCRSYQLLDRALILSGLAQINMYSRLLHYLPSRASTM